MGEQSVVREITNIVGVHGAAYWVYILISPPYILH